MKKTSCAKGCILSICTLLCSNVHLSARTETDSLSVTSTHTCRVDNTHRLSLKEVLIPTAIFGASALCASNGWLVKQRNCIQQTLSADGNHRTNADDYLQYSQMVAVYGLNLCGVKGKHSFWDRTAILAMSYATMGILVNSMKHTFKEKRPDSDARNSFPSGHTATAFMGAEFLYKEYYDVSPLIGYSGYAIAAITGYLRIYNKRHYLNDVIAGACIGILSTKFAYWLYPKCFKKAKCNNHQSISCVPFYNSIDKTFGLNTFITF